MINSSCHLASGYTEGGMPARQTRTTGISAALRKDHMIAGEYPPEGVDEVPIAKSIRNRNTYAI